jgi:hypothetical protein
MAMLSAGIGICLQRVKRFFSSPPRSDRLWGTINTWALFPWLNRPESDVRHFHLFARLRILGAVPPFPVGLYSVVLN